MKQNTYVLSLLVAALVASVGCTNGNSNRTLHKMNFEGKPLTPLQFQVTQKNATEPPNDNEYWDNKKEGIYVDIVSGEPLFSSKEKYVSGTGWPSFWKPLVEENIVEREDKSLFLGNRTEVRSKSADSHLGHVFKDGPAPTGLRYCINSAALKFIAAEDLVKMGYDKFVPLFASKQISVSPFSNPKKKVEIGEDEDVDSSFVVVAGGCFWGVQEVYNNIIGVTKATAGYSGGTTANPTYEAVTSGETGHAESVKVVFNPRLVKIENLLEVFFDVVHDPTQLNKQGPDVGTHYRSAIFYKDEQQKRKIETFIVELEKSGRIKGQIVTQVTPLTAFYEAEGYHQNFCQKNPSNPYVLQHDKPKLEMLKEKYPDLVTPGS